MKIEKIGVGASILEAYEDGKRQLNAPFDAVIEKETICDVQKKLFGLKKTPAQVRVWYEIPDEPKKPEKKPAQQAKPAFEKKPAQDKKPTQDKKPAEKKPAPEKKPAAEKKPAPEKKPAQDKKPVQAQAAPEAKKPREEKKNPQPKAKKQPSAEEAADEGTLVPVEIAAGDLTAAYISDIVKGLGIGEFKLTLEKYENSNEYVYTISAGDDDGVLIGRRGETLDALQYLVRLFINKGIDEDKHRKISLNVGNYREKRNDNLRALAARSARSVLKYGKNAVLEPMNPYERRIVHTAIQGIEGVTSHSIGYESNRRVVISLEEGVEPTHPGRGGEGGRRGGRDFGRGGRGSYDRKREAYKPNVTREPRKDAAGSLYGKIEIPAKKTEE